MKQYFKPILLSGLTPGDGGDPFVPPGGEGSVTGGTTKSRVVPVDEQSRLVPQESSMGLLSQVQLPAADAEAAAEAVASPEVAPEIAVDLSPVEEAVPISIP